MDDRKKFASVPRDFKDSGYYYLTNSSTIASGDFYDPIFDDRYENYDDVLITNLDTSNDCEVKVNYGETHILPAGNSLQLNQLVVDLKIKNIGSTTISASGIRIQYRNTGYKKQSLIEKGTKIAQGIFFLGRL